MGPLRDNNDSMKQFTKSVLLVSIFLISLSAPLLSTNAEAQDVSDIEVLHTAVNPYNNNTYHLLSEASWSESAQVAVGLDGFLVTVDDEQENQWLMETFANFDNLSRHLWIGLSDYNNEGDYRWHDGTPFLYRNWGAEQPSANGEEDYVHIASTNMGNIMPGNWNDLEDDPQYFPVYGVVEVGPGADYALRFDGVDDKLDVSAHSNLFTFAGGFTFSTWILFKTINTTSGQNPNGYFPRLFEFNNFLIDLSVK